MTFQLVQFDFIFIWKQSCAILKHFSTFTGGGQLIFFQTRNAVNGSFPRPKISDVKLNMRLVQKISHYFACCNWWFSSRWGHFLSQHNNEKTDPNNVLQIRTAFSCNLIHIKWCSHQNCLKTWRMYVHSFHRGLAYIFLKICLRMYLLLNCNTQCFFWAREIE